MKTLGFTPNSHQVYSPKHETPRPLCLVHDFRTLRNRSLCETLELIGARPGASRCQHAAEWAKI